MNLTAYEPWNIINQINELLGSSIRRQDSSTMATSSWAPAVDVQEEQDSYCIRADLPGVNQNDIDVFMDNGVLTIKGKRECEHKEEGANYSRIERMYGSFHRQFTLPDTANSENIQAEYTNGVLSLKIPKKEASKPRRISITQQNLQLQSDNNTQKNEQAPIKDSANSPVQS